MKKLLLIIALIGAAAAAAAPMRAMIRRSFFMAPTVPHAEASDTWRSEHEPHRADQRAG
jgi:hypothetical protein